MNESNYVDFFSGLRYSIGQIKKMRTTYDPQLAFDFNSFDFWKTDEPKTSKIIAYFLNPKSSHGQGNFFLKIFLTKFEIKEGLELIDEVNSGVKWTEHHFNSKTTKAGRYIDI